MGTRICIMNGGKVVQVGPPLEVYREPANTFVASFLGNPPMNLLPARVAEGNGAAGGQARRGDHRAQGRALPAAGGRGLRSRWAFVRRASPSTRAR